MNQSVNLTLDDNKALPILFGEKNRNISDLEKKIGVAIAIRGNILSISGDSVAVASEKGSKSGAPKEDIGDIVIRTRTKVINPRSRIQKKYLHALAKYDLTLATGPAGTGKTYLAVAAAVQAYLNQQVGKTPYMQSVHLTTKLDKFGNMAYVLITGTHQNSLSGEIVESTPSHIAA